MPRRVVRFPDTEIVEHFDAAHRSDHSTRFVASVLRVTPGATAAEAGCGTGVLACVAARRGAAQVWASDVVPAAVALAEATARASGLPQVRVVLGPMLDPVPPGERLDLVVAVMPQKPATAEFSARYAGGPDGADLLVALIEAASERLGPGGRILLYHHSIAAPDRVESALARAFAWRVVAERDRCIARTVYDGLAPGMLRHALSLAARGTIRLRERGPHLVWRSRVLEGVRR